MHTLAASQHSPVLQECLSVCITFYGVGAHGRSEQPFRVGRRKRRPLLVERILFCGLATGHCSSSSLVLPCRSTVRTSPTGIGQTQAFTGSNSHAVHYATVEDAMDLFSMVQMTGISWACSGKAASTWTTCLPFGLRSAPFLCRGPALDPP